MAERKGNRAVGQPDRQGRAGRFAAQVRPAHPGAQSGDVRGRSDRAGGYDHPHQQLPRRSHIAGRIRIADRAVAVVHGRLRELRRSDGRGRGKAQADNLRKTRTQTQARQIKQGQEIMVPATSLRRDDVVMVKAGEVIPGDGEVIEGVAAVNEAAITGESAPVIRESGGDRSAVTGGTTVISDWIKVRITANPGETFLDRMIALVEGAQRQKTPNEIALSILLAGLTIIFMLVCVSLYPFALYGGTSLSLPVLVALLVCLIPTTIGGLLSAIGIAGMDRLVQHNVLAMSGARSRRRATSIRCCSTRPARSRSATGWRRNFCRCSTSRGGSRRRRATRVAGRRNARGPFDRGAGETRVQFAWPRSGGKGRAVHPIYGANPHERRRYRRSQDSQRRGRPGGEVRARPRRRRRPNWPASSSASPRPAVLRWWFGCAHRQQLISIGSGLHVLGESVCSFKIGTFSRRRVWPPRLSVCLEKLALLPRLLIPGVASAPMVA